MLRVLASNGLSVRYKVGSLSEVELTEAGYRR